MEFKKYIAYHEGFLFIIDEDWPGVGAALYILKNKKVLFDYFQNIIQICKEQANDEYGVPLESWAELNNLKDFPWLKD
jgi:hypothetical protein